jgi:hypothetical protein
MKVREETDEELAKTNDKSPFSPTSSKAPASDGATSPTTPSGGQQQFFRVFI